MGTLKKKDLCQSLPVPSPFDHFHASLETAVEVAFTTSASQNLRFDDELVGREGFGDFVGLLWCVSSF